MLAANEQNPVDWMPKANIGILTGEVSGIFVLDIDNKEADGFGFLGNLEAQHPEEPIPNTLMVRTGSGGRHYFFQWPGYNVGNVKPWGSDAGIDIRGDQGQVVAPPSISGYGSYVITADITSIRQIAAAPGWILEALKKEDAYQHGEPVGTDKVLPDKLISAYVNKALESEAQVVRDAPRGDRNNRLNSSAFSLGTLGALGILFEEEARAALENAAQAAGLGMAEIRATFSSGWRSGLEHPRDLSQVGELADHEWAKLSWDDFGLGDRLVNRRGDVLRWVEDWNSWMICLNGAWQKCSSATPEMLSQWVIRRMYEDESEMYSDDSAEKGKPSPRMLFWEWWKSCRNRPKVLAMAMNARDHPSIRALSTSFDDHPFLLNVSNGIIDLETGKLFKHEPSLMMTRQAPVSYDPGLLDDPLAASPQWKAFLERVQPDPELRAFLQRVIGYSITGSMAEQSMFLHYGSSANGKSTFHDIISYVLGPYAQATPVETLTAKRNDGMVPNDVARMMGKRYLLASEAKEGRRLDWPLLKQLIGGDRIAARFMRAEFFEFSPVGKIHLTANHLPPIPGDDPAIWRRLRPIEWTEFIPEAERDGDLPEKLRAEAQGILAWCIAGAISWKAQGLAVPEAAHVVKESYRQEEDIVTPLIGTVLQRTEPTKPGMHSVGHDIKDIYGICRFEWQANGIEPISQRALTTALQKMGFTRIKSNGRAYFIDLAVSAPMPENNTQ